MSVPSSLPAHLSFAPNALEALQALSTPVWVFDARKLRIAWANRAAVEFWRAESTARLLERDFALGFSPATQARLKDYAQRLETETRITEQWTLFPGSCPVTVMCSFTLLPWPGAGPAFLVEATPAFPGSASGDTLRAVEAVRHTTALISVIDLGGHTLMENPAALRAYGHLRAGPPKHAFTERFADGDDAARALQRVSNGKEFEEEVWVHTREGVRRHAMEARQTTDPVTGTRAILLSEIDVTFRHEAEEVVRRLYSELESRVKDRTLELERLNRELGEERQFVSAVVETVGSLLIVADAHGTVVRVNRALCELTGYEAGELTGRPLWETLLASPEAERVERAFAEHGPRLHAVMPKNVEGLLRTKAGEPRVVSFTNAALLDTRGLMTEYVIGAGVDVTDRKEIELRLQISDRMASIGTLAAGVAHGMNNPLAYVIANLDFVRNKLAAAWSELPPEDVREVRELLSESLEGADRVRRIVGDLRMFSRQSEDHVQAVDLIAVIERALNMSMNEIRHRARVVLNLTPVPRVLGTESKLGQVVLNLLVNAAQAIEAGNVENNCITVRTLLDKHGRPRLEIQDTGVGIPEEYLRRVFDPFFTTKPVGVGTGLGLSISHRIVSEFGGEIGIESEHLRGTLVWMALETAPLEVVVPKQPTYPPPSARPHAARVLIVDDEPAILRALSRVLSGYEVTRALSGKEALSHIEGAGPFDVVFCDVMMPELSGIDVYERVKQAWPGQEQRIVFITGGAFTEHAAKFLESIDNPKLGKPFDAGEVRALVKALTRDLAPDALGAARGV